MGRIKQLAQRSQLAPVAEDQEEPVLEQGVKAEAQDAEMTISDQVDGHSEQHGMSFDTSFNTASYVAEQVSVSDAESFEYNDDAVDEDFQEDSGDSDYEESPFKKRRGNAKLSTQKRAAKPSTPPKSSKQPVRMPARKSLKKPASVAATSTSRSRRSRAKSNQGHRALQKAHRDVESKLSAGQPENTANRPLNCLPYRTNNRASKRELIRWNDDTYQHTLLAMAWALETREVAIPWDDIAAIVHPGATGEAFKQAVTKLRTKRVKEDLPVPPLRPGKDRPRRDCEADLAMIVAEAKKVRERITGTNNTSCNGDNGDDDPDKLEEGGQPEDDAMEIVSVSPNSSNGFSSIVRAVSTDVSPTSLIVQVATGNIHHVQPRPTAAVSRLQNRIDGLETDMDIPLLGSSSEDVTAQPVARPVVATGSPINGGWTKSIKEGAPESRVRRSSGMAPVTPPAQPCTPVNQTALPDSELEGTLEPPPAPRSDYRRRTHSRKRSGDDVGPAPATPTSKRRQPSFSLLHQTGRYQEPASMEEARDMMPPGYYGRSRHRSFHGMGMGPYGGLIPNNPADTPYLYPNGPTGYNMDGFPMDRRLARDVGRRSTISQDRPDNVDPAVLRDYTYQRFGPNAAANLISQQENFGSQQPSHMHPHMPDWNMGSNMMNGGGFHNHWNWNVPPPASNGTNGPATNAYGTPLEFGEELKPPVSQNTALGEQSTQFGDELRSFDSQNTASGEQSTQGSFGSTVQGSRVTPSNPPPPGDNDRKRKVQDD